MIFTLAPSDLCSWEKLKLATLENSSDRKTILKFFFFLDLDAAATKYQKQLAENDIVPDPIKVKPFLYNLTT